ncbi:hypothetical protein PCLA_07f0082 [Pseudomonas citronellolis]|nr:hypothetical protein PCLA_07f0082 [Pseudomonas citronellolis]
MGIHTAAGERRLARERYATNGASPGRPGVVAARAAAGQGAKAWTLLNLPGPRKVRPRAEDAAGALAARWFFPC